MPVSQRFRTVWRLVNGLLTSANAMVSTLVLVVAWPGKALHHAQLVRPGST